MKSNRNIFYESFKLTDEGLDSNDSSKTKEVYKKWIGKLRYLNCYMSIIH